MSPTLPLDTSTSFSAPFFSVTSSRPSGRKVIAQGSSRSATAVVANGLPGLLVSGDAGVSCGPTAASGCALLVPLHAVHSRAATQAAVNNDLLMAVSTWIFEG